MTTRILITDDTGQPLQTYASPNAAAAAAWAAATVATLRAQSISALAFEVHPVRGGDDYSQHFAQQIGRHRIDLHTRPDGAREVIGVLRHSDARGTRLRTAEAAQCTLRLIESSTPMVCKKSNLARHAPSATVAQQRTARRLARAQRGARA